MPGKYHKSIRFTYAYERNMVFPQGKGTDYFAGMKTLRRSDERGHFNHGWLDTYHTFSFGDYYDPDFTQFRSLRVMNEDRVQPSGGFGMHGHRDTAIVTYVLSGQLDPRDSLGHGEMLRPGQLQ